MYASAQGSVGPPVQYMRLCSHHPLLQRHSSIADTCEKTLCCQVGFLSLSPTGKLFQSLLPIFEKVNPCCPLSPDLEVMCHFHELPIQRV